MIYLHVHSDDGVAWQYLLKLSQWKSHDTRLHLSLTQFIVQRRSDAYITWKHFGMCENQS